MNSLFKKSLLIATAALLTAFTPKEDYGKLIKQEETEQHHTVYYYEGMEFNHIVETKDDDTLIADTIIPNTSEAVISPTTVPEHAYISTHKGTVQAAKILEDGSKVLVIKYENGLMLYLRDLRGRLIMATVVYPVRPRA
jgi:hypothetical protein